MGVERRDTTTCAVGYGRENNACFGSDDTNRSTQRWDFETRNPASRACFSLTLYWEQKISSTSRPISRTFQVLAVLLFCRHLYSLAVICTHPFCFKGHVHQDDLQGDMGTFLPARGIDRQKNSIQFPIVGFGDTPGVDLSETTIEKKATPPKKNRREEEVMGVCVRECVCCTTRYE